MPNKLVDCSFYFNSICTKGDRCAYRHCEVARECEIVCTEWNNGRCTDANCQFRHPQTEDKRSRIQCFYEEQPGGCCQLSCPYYHKKPRLERKHIQCIWDTKPTGCQNINCAFLHRRPRFIGGACLPPSLVPQDNSLIEIQIKMIDKIRSEEAAREETSVLIQAKNETDLNEFDAPERPAGLRLTHHSEEHRKKRKQNSLELESEEVDHFSETSKKQKTEATFSSQQGKSISLE